MWEKVLFVDDDQLVLTCLERLFGKRFNIDTALGSDAALDALMNRGPYAVIVSDLRMPKLSGIQLLTRARQLSSQTVGVILTGNADFPDADEALRNGLVFKFIDKPCHPDVLRKVVEEALAHYQENEKVPEP